MALEQYHRYSQRFVASLLAPPSLVFRSSHSPICSSVTTSLSVMVKFFSLCFGILVAAGVMSNGLSNLGFSYRPSLILNGFLLPASSLSLNVRATTLLSTESSAGSLMLKRTRESIGPEFLIHIVLVSGLQFRATSPNFIFARGPDTVSRPRLVVLRLSGQPRTTLLKSKRVTGAPVIWQWISSCDGEAFMALEMADKSGRQQRR